MTEQSQDAESSKEQSAGMRGEQGSGGGRSTRGPAIRAGGEQEPAGLVPPYDGRKESANLEADAPESDVNIGGATGPQPAEPGLASPEPSETLGGSTTTPADEQPAADVVATKPTDEGVPPAHHRGTTRGEDQAK